uniref:Mating-type protein MAT-1 n=1 Tax=Cochliobolus ellisii TaxID=91237 RepID=MAT1_COCEL|nr:RecName: Full=Mating-type protein MAT-1 [Curvularia ellisii]AAD33449.1 mating type protein MAT-1 [Curvularia ellisii]
MDSARAPTEDEIAKFLATRTSSQMLQLMRCIKQPAAQFAFTAKLLTITPVKNTPPTVPEKAKKALNAFVGFRCYYIAIPAFKPWPMKKLSNLISLLWEGDPNKSLWSLMAKAWSNIRDQVGKDQAPLDEFFGIICPHLELPDPAYYLDLHGWSLGVNQEGDPTLLRIIDSKPASIGIGHINLALSVEDIITFVQKAGFAPTYTPDANDTSPTFLGQSLSSTFEVNHPANSIPAASQVDQARVAARNRRRAKRQSARELEFQEKLENDLEFKEKINREMDLVLERTPPAGPDPLPDFDFTPFYEGVNNLICEHMAMEQSNAGYPEGAHLFNDFGIDSSKAYLGMDNFATDMPDLIDYDAFRLGANEDVALPVFDDIAHA